MVSTRYPFKAPRRLLQIAGATVLAAVSGWLALDYLGAARVPGVADAVALPVEMTPVMPAAFKSVVAAATSTVRSGTQSMPRAQARTRRAPVKEVIAEASSAVAAPAGAETAEATGSAVSVVQPQMILPPPVAMLAAACALQQKLAEAAQVH